MRTGPAVFRKKTMTSVRQFLRPSCFASSLLSRITSQKRPFPSLYRRCSLDLTLPRGSKRDNRVTMPTRIGKNGKPRFLSLSAPFSISLFVSHTWTTRARIRGVWCGMVWCDVARCGLDSTRFAWRRLIDASPWRRFRRQSSSYLRAPLFLDLFLSPAVAAPSRRYSTRRHPPEGWVDGWMGGRVPTHRTFVTSSTVIVSHHDPLRGSVSREVYHDEVVDATCDILRS